MTTLVCGHLNADTILGEKVIPNVRNQDILLPLNALFADLTCFNLGHLLPRSITRLSPPSSAWDTSRRPSEVETHLPQTKAYLGNIVSYTCRNESCQLDRLIGHGFCSRQGSLAAVLT